MRKSTPAEQPQKMSDIMKEMSEQLFRNPDAVHSSEAAHVAMFFANVAWNECVGLGSERERIHNVWKTIEAENPNLWDELKSRDIDAMIDGLVEYKKAHFPDDRRRILTCGGTERSTIRVEWLPPAAPGEDLCLKSLPCTFLNDNGRCTIYDVRPRDCAEYPHTHKRGFSGRTRLHAGNAIHCPAVFWIVEQLRARHRWKP